MKHFGTVILTCWKAQQTDAYWQQSQQVINEMDISRRLITIFCQVKVLCDKVTKVKQNYQVGLLKEALILSEVAKVGIG